MSARAHKPSWFDVQPRAIDGKEPPSDLDAEQRVKTAMLIVPGFIDRVCPPLEPEHFYSEANRRIVESILAVRARDGEVDAIRVVEHLSELERLHQVGGAKALATPAKLTSRAA
jgi:replicative DNA helicase